jgi:two-component system KDP operon response regulator KdpE
MEDWSLLVVYSSKQCLDVVKNGSCPDVVVLGNNLKDMMGLDLIERIRDYSDVPVIFLSDVKNIDTLVRAYDAGANDYVVCPFNEAIFIARIKSLIRRRRWNIQAMKNKTNRNEL